MKGFFLFTAYFLRFHVLLVSLQRHVADVKVVWLYLLILVGNREN